MCHSATVRENVCLPFLVAGLLLLSGAAQAQPPLGSPEMLRPDWRRIGNSAVDLFLASPATGSVERVWYSEDGTSLFVLTGAGRVFETTDFETWKPVDITPPPAEEFPVSELSGALPDPVSKVRAYRGSSFRLYAFGYDVYRSDDGGSHWINLTRFRQESIIGTGMNDLAISPADPNQLMVANEYGVWRSLDGGISWSGLNDALPNLRVRQLLAAPDGTRGVRALFDGIGAIEWAPGEKEAWRPYDDEQVDQQLALRRAASEKLGTEITAVAISAEYSYAGSRDGRLWVSSDQGQTWRSSRSAPGGAIKALFVVPNQSRLALAAVGSGTGVAEYPRVLRTFNGGLFWDDLTANLPEGNVHGVTADPATGAVYVATDRGVYLAFTDLSISAPVTDWIPMTGSLPAAPAMDVRLDPLGNQLFVVLEGYGVYAAPAPHRFWDVQVVNAADFSQRPVAPGSLLSVLGARLMRAQAGFMDVPVLHASDSESEIQIPFEISGQSAQLALGATRGEFTFELPLQEVSPAIFVDRDGTPLLLNGDTGLLLDAMTPAHSNVRVQILATGLGRVQPAWPTGMAAPLEEPPQVITPVRVFLDRTPVEVTRATLAPGYVGFYLVEVQLPSIVNSGPAELYIEAGGHESNRVRIYLEP